MDLRPIQHPEATSSSSTSNAHPGHDSHSVTASETKPIRSSARVKAAKQKAQTSDQSKDRDSSNPDQPGTTALTTPLESISTRNARVSPTKVNRFRESNTGKGKARELPQESFTRHSKRCASLPHLSDFCALTFRLYQPSS
jgi:E3 ubiquitin-protein ligase TRIP12